MESDELLSSIALLLRGGRVRSVLRVNGARLAVGGDGGHGRRRRLGVLGVAQLGRVDVVDAAVVAVV